LHIFGRLAARYPLWSLCIATWHPIRAESVPFRPRGP